MPRSVSVSLKSDVTSTGSDVSVSNTTAQKQQKLEFTLNSNLMYPFSLKVQPLGSQVETNELQQNVFSIKDVTVVHPQ